MRPDITVSDSAGLPVLAVEVKARWDKGADWASQLWSNLRAHGFGPPSEYFLIVTLDLVFLWRHGNQDVAPSREPDLVVPTSDILGPRLSDLDSPSERIGEAALEHLVASWLATIVNASSPADLPAGSRFLVERSGLYDDIQGGDLRLQVA